MYKPQRDNRSGGWKGGNDFGRKKPWDRGFDNRGGGRPEMHQATCHECGDPCEVPFRPTGERPVFCTKHFKRDGNAGDRRSSFHDRPSFNKPEFRSQGGAPSAITDQYKEQFKNINAKLDAILKILNPIVPAVAPVVETPKVEAVVEKKAVKEKPATKKKKAAKAK